ncbi:MAG: hypothetical protein PHX86_00760 [Caldisericia bacterium]|nr:hypothetical protein [Caldisericia bacterium]
MIKSLFVYFLVLSFSFGLFSLHGCTKSIESSDLTKTYHSSEIVYSENLLSVVFQNIVSAPSLRIPTSITNIRQFPFTYLNTEGTPMRIVKITRDGNTLDLLIDKPQVKTAYIIEEPEDLSAIPIETNASYMVNRYTAELKPIQQEYNLAMVSLSLQNRSRKKVSLDDIPIYFMDGDGNQYPVDHYLSDSLMTCEYPSFLKRDEIYALRFLGLIPSTLKECFVHVDGISFQWNIDVVEGS